MRALAPGAALWLALSMPASAGELGFVYVESNVGGASGGHFALRVDERVYSYFGADDGTLALERERWSSALFRYASLENRPVHVAYVSLPDPALARIRDELSRDFLARGRRATGLERVRRNLELLQAIAGERRGISVEGAGLLDPTRPPSRAGLALRARIEAGLGVRYVANRLAELELELSRLQDGNRGSEGWTRVREQLGEVAALRALERADGLDPEAVVSADGSALAAAERALLAGARERQAENVLALLTSARPDRGPALFLAAARHHALSVSLEESRLLLVAPSPIPTVRRAPDGAPADVAESVAIERRTRALLARHPRAPATPPRSGAPTRCASSRKRLRRRRSGSRSPRGVPPTPRDSAGCAPPRRSRSHRIRSGEGP